MISIVFMFHDVVDKRCITSGFQTIGARQYELTADRFEAIVNVALKIDENVLFTFDDGGVSFEKVIAPILEKNNKKGIFFIATSRINSDGFLTSKQIRKLHGNGHIIASHSHTHPRDISKLPYDAIVYEWSVSKKILEDIIGEEITTASIPGGAMSKKVLKAMTDAGYTVIYTSEPTNKVRHINASKAIGRFAVLYNTTNEQVKAIIADAGLRRRLLLRYKLLRLVKDILGANYNRIKQTFLHFKK